MKTKITISLLIIVVFLIVGFFAFVDNKVEYANFQTAAERHKTCQVKGEWVKNKETRFDASKNQFIFYMKDENNTEMKVVLEGAKPNNFEMAEKIVAKGKITDGYFHAKDVLTKCPSKYEGQGEDVKKTGI